MDRTDVLKVMAVLRGAYPQFYRNISKQEAEDTVNLWLDLFGGEPYPLVFAAVKSFISSDEEGFPPVPGKIMGKLRLLTHSDEMTELDAWEVVSRALRNSTYGSREEFEKFPPVIKRLVGSPAQLREWAAMSSEIVNSVISSNFQRSYRSILQREREIAKLPPDVRALVEKISDGKKLGDLPEKKQPLPPQRPEDKPVPMPREKMAAAISPGTGRSREEVLAFLKGGG